MKTTKRVVDTVDLGDLSISIEYVAGELPRRVRFLAEADGIPLEVWVPAETVERIAAAVEACRQLQPAGYSSSVCADHGYWHPTGGKWECPKCQLPLPEPLVPLLAVVERAR